LEAISFWRWEEGEWVFGGGHWLQQQQRFDELSVVPGLLEGRSEHLLSFFLSSSLEL
jgi:hypothetical protein